MYPRRQADPDSGACQGMTETVRLGPWRRHQSISQRELSIRRSGLAVDVARGQTARAPPPSHPSLFTLHVHETREARFTVTVESFDGAVFYIYFGGVWDRGLWQGCDFRWPF